MFYSQLGYRDGHAAGIEASMQEGFNKGFACSIPLVSRLAQLKGILQSVLCKTILCIDLVLLKYVKSWKYCNLQGNVIKISTS